MITVKNIVLPAKRRLPVVHGHEVLTVEAEWYEGSKDCTLYRLASGGSLVVKRDIEGNEKAKVIKDNEVARKLIIKAEAQAARDDEADLVDIDADAPA